MLEFCIILVILREKEGYLAQPYDKNPFTNRKFENQWTTQNATKNLDYTAVINTLNLISIIFKIKRVNTISIDFRDYHYSIFHKFDPCQTDVIYSPYCQ